MHFPWSVLGLEGPGTEADIRRAYARKLKALDLDKDSEAFQQLVQARSFALRIAAGEIVVVAADADEAAQDEPDARQPSQDEIVREIEARIDAVLEHAVLREDEAFDEGDGEQEFEDRSAPFGFAPHAVSLQDLTERLEAASEDGWQGERAGEWHAILNDMTLLPLGGMKRLEPHVVSALAAVMLTPVPLAPSNLPWWKRLRRVNRFRRATRYSDPHYLDTVPEFAALYGWSTSDAAIWNVLEPDTAERFLVHLQAACDAKAALDKTLPSVRGKNARPMPRRDLIAALNENVAEVALSSYESFLKTGRWPRSWNWGYLIYAPIAMLFGHMKRLFLLWFVLLFTLPHQAKNLPPAIKDYLLLASFAGVVALHVWVSFYWYRGHLWRAKKRIAQADAYGIFHPNLRWTFLSGGEPDDFGDRSSASTMSQRIWLVVFLLIVGTWLVRPILQAIGFTR